jgi:hypothetical protein
VSTKRVTAAEHLFLFDASRDDWRQEMEKIAMLADRNLRNPSTLATLQYAV